MTNRNGETPHTAPGRRGAGIAMRLAGTVALCLVVGGASTCNRPATLVTTRAKGAEPGLLAHSHPSESVGPFSTAEAETAAPRPRIWLDATLLTTLRQRAAANSPAWIALKSRCDKYLTGTVEWPDGNHDPSAGSIGEGYQGSGYFDPLLSLGLSYQVCKTLDPTKATLYAAKGVDILTKMAAVSGVHAVNPLRDSGYGIRFYGVGMAIGYDWFYDALSAAQKQAVYIALNRWIDAFTKNGFGREHPQGNYFAGYYAAKALAALTTQGDNPLASDQWQDWLTRLHGQMVQPYYAAYLVGGGWPEGWNYGPVGTLNMSWPILAARSAKGLDLLHGPKPFTFPADQGLHLIHFTWPNRITLDDRGALYSSENPSSTRPSFITCEAGLQSLFGAASAPVFHRFAREVRSLQTDKAEPWQEFLFWDDKAAEEDFTSLPRSYWSRGTNMVAVRSSWAKDAVWGSFTASPYINYPGSGEQFFDQGSLAIVRGGTPFLVNSTGALLRPSNGVNDGDTFWEFIYRENFGNYDADPTQANRTIYNVFYVKHDRYGQAAYDPTVAHARISRFEDRDGYVLMRGRYLEELYRPDPVTKVRPVAAWTRDIVYVRPKTFVLYDRTTTTNAAEDQWQAFHLAKQPLEVNGASPGTHRFDVTNGSTFVGSVTTLLPYTHKTTLENLYNSNKVYRLSVRPGTPGTLQRWLTVFDAASSADQVAKPIRLSAGDGNVQSGSVQGVLLTGGFPNYVVLFGTKTPDEAVNGPIQYCLQAQSTLHIVTQLGLNTSYKVTVSVANGKHTVKIEPGAGMKSSGNGVLYFLVDAAGRVTAR